VFSQWRRRSGRWRQLLTLNSGMSANFSSKIAKFGARNFPFWGTFKGKIEISSIHICCVVNLQLFVEKFKFPKLF